MWSEIRNQPMVIVKQGSVLRTLCTSKCALTLLDLFLLHALTIVNYTKSAGHLCVCVCVCRLNAKTAEFLKTCLRIIPLYIPVENMSSILSICTDYQPHTRCGNDCSSKWSYSHRIVPTEKRMLICSIPYLQVLHYVE